MSFSRYDLIAQNGRIVRSNAKMLYLSTAKYGGDWHSIPHTHAFAELFYVVGGDGKFRIENEVHQVSAGDLVIVNPNVEHTETSLDARPLEYIVLGVDDLELSVAEGQDGRFCIVHFRGRQEEIQTYFRTMQREIEAKPPGYEIVCQDLFDVIVVFLMRQTNSAATMAPASRNRGRVCAIIQRYIDKHYKEALTLEALAGIAHVSKYHVAHTFKKEYGISPMSYLVAKRIEESKQLLETTDYPLSRLAQMLGFSSGSYFSQSFHRLEGISPMEYRRIHRNDSREGT